MNCEKIITRWNGLLPIVEDMPNIENLWEKIDCYMDMIRDIGAKDKNHRGLEK